MKTDATVIIPTFDHGPTLNYSLPTALNQTVKNIEVFVISDGSPPETEQIVNKFARQDKRVKWFSFPKDKRHGEVYRHQILQKAKGEIVCYLSDDDLWLPNHIEVMQGALRTADFACTLPVRITPEGKAEVKALDFSEPFYLNMLLEIKRGNRVPLTCAAHRLDFYKKLPHGWRTSPQAVASDLFMWRQFLNEPSVRLSSRPVVTGLHFASVIRPGVSIVDRTKELDKWAKKIKTAGFYEKLYRELLEFLLSEIAKAEIHSAQAADKNFELNATINSLKTDLAQKSGELQLIKSSRVWRLRSKLRSIFPGRQ